MQDQEPIIVEVDAVYTYEQDVLTEALDAMVSKYHRLSNDEEWTQTSREAFAEKKKAALNILKQIPARHY